MLSVWCPKCFYFSGYKALDLLKNEECAVCIGRQPMEDVCLLCRPPPISFKDTSLSLTLHQNTYSHFSALDTSTFTVLEIIGLCRAI